VLLREAGQVLVEGTPNGEQWEIYTVLADSPTFFGELTDGPACRDGDSTETATEPVTVGAAGSLSWTYKTLLRFDPTPATQLHGDRAGIAA
jgi:hypothetical protein